MVAKHSMVTIGARGPYGVGSYIPARELPAEPRLVDEFLYLSFHKNTSGGRMPPCNLKLFDNTKVEFVGINRSRSSGQHGYWARHELEDDPDNYAELEVWFHWNGNEDKVKTMIFQKCPGQSHLWQSKADSLASAVVLVRTTPIEIVGEQL